MQIFVFHLDYGSIGVLNEGVRADGSKSSIVGSARQNNPGKPGELTLMFPGSKYNGDLFESAF